MKRSIAIIIATCSLFIIWCSTSPKIQQGDKVTISYTWTLQNGEIFETETKTITIWSWEIIKWIEQALLKKKLGEYFSTTIKPEEWYKQLYSENKQQHVSAYIFERLWISTEIGKKVTLGEIQGIIIANQKNDQGNSIIVIDENPEQTRQKTEYTISIQNIEKSTTNTKWYTL